MTVRLSRTWFAYALQSTAVKELQHFLDLRW